MISVSSRLDLRTRSLIHHPSSRTSADEGIPAEVRLPDESAGIDEIARILVSVFDQADIIAPGETHQWRLDTDLRIAVVRRPDFAKKVRSIVVEFASTTEKPTLDRYIRGENVSRAQFEQVWKTTTQAANGIWDNPVYAEFLAAVRDVNSRLPADARIRVFGGDPGPGDNRSRETAAVAVLKEQVLQKHGKAVIELTEQEREELTRWVYVPDARCGRRFQSEADSVVVGWRQL